MLFFFQIFFFKNKCENYDISKHLFIKKMRKGNMKFNFFLFPRQYPVDS